jgi:tetratricopeptide (TPR) repeat protein
MLTILAAALLILVFSFLALAQPKGGKLMSGDVFTPLSRGYDLIRDGKYEAALSQFEEVLRVDPANPFALNNLAVLRERQGKLNEAMAYLIAAQEHAADYRDKLQQTCFPGGLCAAVKPTRESGPTSMIATVLADNTAKLRDKMVKMGLLEPLPAPGGGAPGSCRFVVMGDSIGYKYHINRATLYYINNEILKLRPLPAFLVFAGDLGFHGGVKIWQEWRDGLFHFTHVEDIGKIGTCKMPGVQIFPKI